MTHDKSLDILNLLSLLSLPLQSTNTLHLPVCLQTKNGHQELVTSPADKNMNVFDATDTLDTSPVLEPKYVPGT